MPYFRTASLLVLGRDFPDAITVIFTIAMIVIIIYLPITSLCGHDQLSLSSGVYIQKGLEGKWTDCVPTRIYLWTFVSFHPWGCKHLPEGKPLPWNPIRIIMKLDSLDHAVPNHDLPVLLLVNPFTSSAHARQDQHGPTSRVPAQRRQQLPCKEADNSSSRLADLMPPKGPVPVAVRHGRMSESLNWTALLVGQVSILRNILVIGRIISQWWWT